MRNKLSPHQENQINELMNELSELGHETILLEGYEERQRIVTLISQTKARLLIASDRGEVTEKLLEQMKRISYIIYKRIEKQMMLEEDLKED